MGLLVVFSRLPPGDPLCSPKCWQGTALYIYAGMGMARRRGKSSLATSSLLTCVASVLTVTAAADAPAAPAEAAVIADPGAAAEHYVLGQFNAFLQEHGKAYVDDATFKERLGVFRNNLHFIQEFNRQSKPDSGSVRLDINQFADLTAREFKDLYLSGLVQQTTEVRNGQEAPKKELRDSSGTPAAVPDSMDWRSKGAVTPVKDQRNCGACWAFSTTGAIEGAWFLAGHPLVSLSEQELVDCSAGFRGGCAGGEPSDAFNWVHKHGLCANESYPWTAYSDECHNQFSPCEAIVQIEGYKRVEENNEQALKVALSQQPVSVQIEADTDVFRFYKSGVLSGSGCGTSLDHAVLAVGYGSEGGKDYWLVKNSWNASWGEQGYVRLARTDSAASYGECGIAMHPLVPVISSEALVV